MSTLRSVSRTVARRFETLALAVLLLVLVGLVLLQVGSRLLGDPVRWTEEVARFAIIWLTFLGAATCVRTREHVAFELLAHYARNRPKIRRALNIFVVTVIVAFMLVLLVTSIEWVNSVRVMGLHAVTIPVPTYIIGLIVPLSALLAIVYSVIRYLTSRTEDEVAPRAPDPDDKMALSQKD